MTIVFIVIVFLLFMIYIIAVVAYIGNAWKKALKGLQTEAGNIPFSVHFESADHWEENFFSKMRDRKANGKPVFVVFAPIIFFIALGHVLLYFIHDRLLDAVTCCITFYQIILLGRVSVYAKRLYQPTVAEILNKDNRLPILFLRPFAFDSLPADAIDDEWYSFVKIYTWMDKRTFEERLSSTFTDLGPLIAIGRPGESVSPLGAAREYISGDAWKEKVIYYAKESQLVLLEADATPGMKWEIAHVSEKIGLQRILMVLPPHDEPDQTRYNEWRQRWSNLRSEFSFLPEVSKQTAGILFDVHNNPIAITTKAKASIQQRLITLKKAWLEHRPLPVYAGK